MGEIEKWGRIGRGKERKEREKGREVNNKVSCSFLGQGTLANCPHQETRDKGVPVVASESGPLAGKLLPEYPKW